MRTIKLSVQHGVKQLAHYWYNCYRLLLLCAPITTGGTLLSSRNSQIVRLSGTLTSHPALEA